MAAKYLKVHKKVLPSYFEQVIAARDLLENHQVDTVTAAVKMVGISRATYYKYKDYIYHFEETTEQKRANLSLVLAHEPGSLSAVLNLISEVKASIITISQSIPVAGKATVTISLDISSLVGSIDQLLGKLKKNKQVISAYLDAID